MYPSNCRDTRAVRPVPDRWVFSRAHRMSDVLGQQAFEDCLVHAAAGQHHGVLRLVDMLLERGAKPENVDIAELFER